MGTEWIRWRRQGCRCVLVSVEVLGIGWQVSLPLYRGSAPVSPAIAKSYFAPEGSQWLRHKKNDFAVSWLLPLAVDDWPPFGAVPRLNSAVVNVLSATRAIYTKSDTGESIVGPVNYSRIDFRNAPGDWGLPLTPFCSHGQVDESVEGRDLRDLLAVDARMVRATRRAQRRELPQRALQ